LRKLFGTDGVRGTANSELTPFLALRLGRAAAAVLPRKRPRARVVVGRDTRVSGDMLEMAFVSGLLSGGADVLLLGVVPTPAVSFLTRDLGTDAGVVISASHNPAPENGIKFFAQDGLNHFFPSGINLRPIGQSAQKMQLALGLRQTEDILDCFRVVGMVRIQLNEGLKPVLPSDACSLLFGEFVPLGSLGGSRLC